MTKALLILLTSFIGVPAHAASSVASVGLGGVINDPFLKSKVVTAGYEYRPQAHISVGGDFLFLPDRGMGDWTLLGKNLIEEVHVSPDISKMSYAARITTQVFPGTISNQALQTRVGLGVSFGMVKTADALQALDKQSADDRATVTQHQFHPCAGYVLSGEVWSSGTGVRLRLDHMGFVEAVNATTLQMQQNRLLLIDVMRQF